MQDIFYKTADVQQLLRCSRGTLYRHLREVKGFPRPSRLGRNLIWPRQTFDDWLQRSYGVQSGPT